MLPGQ